MKTNTSISVILTPEFRLENALKQAGIKRPSTVTQLTVAGTLTNDDFKYIRKKMNKTLKELELGEASVENNTIGNKNFSKKLTSVTIPKSITIIEADAFDELYRLTDIKVHPDNYFYSSENGVLFNKEKTKLLTYPQGRQEKHYTIPDSVVCIGVLAFRGSELNSIIIPDSVKKIEKAAFRSSELTSITIPNYVTEIDERVFSYCKSLTTITISDSVTKIASYAFTKCKMLSSITIPNQVEEIGYGAFGGCYRIPSLYIPASVTKINEYAFDECFNLTITVDSDNPVYSSENGVLFNKDKTELIRYPVSQHGDYVIPNSVKKIGECAFYGCSRLTSIVIPNSVTEIEFYAFNDCTGLTAIDIPDSVTESLVSVFVDCPAFITVHPDNPVYKSVNGELWEKSDVQLRYNIF